jgi:YegS/Rv2252/BmrU family lipid kinase
VLVAVVINPVSGRRRGPAAGRTRAEVARAVLSAAGVDGEVLVSQRPGHARELAGTAIARGARLVCAWGGDGTVNDVGCAVAFGPAALGLIPAGSGNGLARALGVPRAPAAALRHALTARERAIDVGEIGGRLFFNVAGVGFDAHVAHEFARSALRRGFRTYAAIVTRELFAYRPRPCHVACGGEPCERRAFLLTIANGPQWGNGALVAPGASLEDGELDLVTYEPVSRLQMARAVPHLFAGTIGRVAGVTMQRITTARISGEPPMRFHVDGEPVVSDTGDLAVRVHAGALRIRA